MRLQMRDRRALWIAALSVVGGLAFRFGAVPFVRHHAELREEVTIARDLMAREAGLIAAAASLDKEIRSSADFMLRNAARLFVAEADPNLTAAEVQGYMDKLASAAGVSVVQMDVEPQDSVHDGVSRVGFRMRGQGDFEGLLGFIDAMETGPKLLAIRDLVIQTPASNNTNAAVEVLEYTVSLDAFAVRSKRP